MVWLLDSSDCSVLEELSQYSWAQLSAALLSWKLFVFTHAHFLFCEYLGCHSPVLPLCVCVCVFIIPIYYFILLFSSFLLILSFQWIQLVLFAALAIKQFPPQHSNEPLSLFHWDCCYVWKLEGRAGGRRRMLICRESLFCGGKAAEEEPRGCHLMCLRYIKNWWKMLKAAPAPPIPCVCTCRDSGPYRKVFRGSWPEPGLKWLIAISARLRRGLFPESVFGCWWMLVHVCLASFIFPSVLSSHGDVRSLWPSLGKGRRWQRPSWGSL